MNATKLVTGSYDEILRIFDTRQMKQTTSELQLNGGIWRLKSNPHQPELLLTACMYHNFNVVNLITDPITILAEYYEHKSICYGCDWSYLKNNAVAADSYYLATCSFYDHKLDISSILKVIH